MKRILCLCLFVASLVLALPAFASGNQEEAGKGAKVTIDFMATGSESFQVMYKELIEAFQKTGTNVHVNYMPHPEGGWEKVRAIFAGGQATDIMRMDDDDVHDFATMGMIVNVSPYIDKDLNRKDYFDAAWSALDVDGQVHSANIAFGTNAFLYNKKLLADSGVKAPTTWYKTWEWNEWVDALAKITKDENRDGRPEVYGAHIIKNHITCLFHSDGTDPRTAKDRVNFEDPRIVSIFKDYADLYKKGLVAPPESDGQVLFFNNKAGMYWGGETDAKNAPDDLQWDAMPLPKMKKHPYTVDYIRCYVIPTQSKKQDAAWEFFKFWFSEEGQTISVNNAAGVPVLRKVAENVFAKSPNPEHRIVFAEALDFEYPLPRDPIGAAWKKIVNSEYPNGLLAGNISPEDFLAHVQNEITKRIVELKKKGQL